MKRLLLPLALLFISVALSGQNDFRQGYVILTSGDTLRGQIDLRRNDVMQDVCKFRADEKSETVKYSPYELSEYRIDNGRCFSTIDLPEGGRIFAEYLVKGKINLYYTTDATGDHYFVQKEGDILRQLPEEETMIHTEKGYFYRQPFLLKGLLMTLTTEAPLMNKEIEKINNFEQREFIKIAVDYHNYVCPDASCTVYRKEIPLIRLSGQVVAGYSHFFVDQGSRFEGGLLLLSWLPLTSERLYFKTGLLYTTIPEGADELSGRNLYKVPLQVRYLMPGKVLRPELSFGPKVYLTNDTYQNLVTYTSDITAALNIKIPDTSAHITIGGSFESMPWLFFFPKLLNMQKVSYSVFGGVSFDF